MGTLVAQEADSHRPQRARRGVHRMGRFGRCRPRDDRLGVVTSMPRRTQQCRLGSGMAEACPVVHIAHDLVGPHASVRRVCSVAGSNEEALECHAAHSSLCLYFFSPSLRVVAYQRFHTRAQLRTEFVNVVGGGIHSAARISSEHPRARRPAPQCARFARAGRCLEWRTGIRSGCEMQWST